jgi:DnaK suppressor protein
VRRPKGTIHDRSREAIVTASASRASTAKAPTRPKATGTKTATKAASKTLKVVRPAPSKAKPAAKAAKAPAKAAKPAAKATKAPAKAATKTAKAAKAPAKAAKATKPAAKAAKAPAPRKPPSALKVATTAAPPKKPRFKIGPYASDAKFLAEIKDVLTGERAVYQEQADALKAEADSLALEREPGDVQFDEESGEGGTVTVDRERDLALSAQALAAVEEIDEALERVRRKTYGVCERCGQAIPKPRLRALPYARLCVACKSGGLSRR